MSTKSTYFIPTLSLLFVLQINTSLAQPPDAGRLMQVQPESPSLSHEVPKKVIEQPAIPALEDLEGIKIVVQEFRVVGETMFETEQLLALLEDLTGKELDFAGLNEAVTRITRHYRDHGYMVARAILPAQDIEGGIVTIKVLEGRLESATLDNKSLAKDHKLQSILDKTLSLDEPLSSASTERAILLVSDFAYARAQGILNPGKEVGTTSLIVETEKGSRFHGGVYVDNYGNYYSGQNRIGATFNLNNPLGIGDILSFGGNITDENLQFGRLGYQIPVFSYGTKIGISYSSMAYELGDFFDDLNAYGKAKTASVTLEHPIVRSLQANLYLRLGYDDKDLEDTIEATNSITKKSAQVISTSLLGEWQDTLFGGGSTKAGVTFTSGDLDIITPAVKAIDATTARTQGRYTKYNVNISRLQHIAGSLSLYVDGRLQKAGDNLDSSEDFSLGGPFSVRAYPQGEAVGDEGWLSTIELRYGLSTPLPGIFVASVFHDRGEVDINYSPWTTDNNTLRRNGTGIGLNWSYKDVFRIHGTVAWRGASLPTSAPDRSPRLYLQCTSFF